MERGQEPNRQGTGYHSASGRRYGRQYAYMTYRPMLSADTADYPCDEYSRSDQEEIKVVHQDKDVCSLNESKATVAKVALEYANLGDNKPNMKKKESKSSSKTMADASHSGSSISSHLRPKEKNSSEKKEKSHTKGKKVSQSRSKKAVLDSSVDDGGRSKSRKTKTIIENNEGACSQKQSGVNGSERDWNLEGGRPKSTRKSSPKQPAGDSVDQQRQGKKQLRRKRAVSSSDKQGVLKHLKHGTKSVSSVSSASVSNSPSTKHKAKTQKDSPRSSSSGADSRNQKSSRSKKSGKDGQPKSSKSKMHRDNQGVAGSPKSSEKRKKTGKSKRQRSECQSRKRNPVVDSVASLPSLCDSSDSETDEDSSMRRTPPHRPRTRTQNSGPEQGPSMQAYGSVVHDMMANLFSSMLARSSNTEHSESDNSIGSPDDQIPDLVDFGSSFSSSSASSCQLSDNEEGSMPSLTSDTNSDSDLSELSSVSHGGSSLGETSMESAIVWSGLPALISDSNSDDSEYTAEEISDMEEDDELYRAADEFSEEIEDAFFPFIQLPPPTNPLEEIIHNRLHHTQEVMQTLFENAILHMLALHPDLQGDQAPPPATKEVIDDLPLVKIQQKHIDEELSCAVCQCEYKLNDSVNKLPCDHLFHPMCITAWLQKSGTCPVCRHVLNPDS
ncbi:E3 ubiquitin-protein ligase Praja-2-like isoform X1 [Ptychodera flava]|uniref:E3 ubiquitin-protein ligase Praja-2-like isoform X1 n=1 Tax=Ptychodera flava TaxID=63121 RepID=UPI00396A1D62